MRGTQTAEYGDKLCEGLIPTYAGNTHPAQTQARCMRAHPHVCGEHFQMFQGRPEKPGSSPRMRGTRCSTASTVSLAGLIPTYAGNTPPSRGRCVCLWAHPHVCGEHCLSQREFTVAVGSSPRMRGTPCAKQPVKIHLGLIPTYAGNTLRRA